MDWRTYLAEIVTYLLGKGHQNALTYTMRQAVSLYMLSSKADNRDKLEQTNMMRAAYHASDKDYNNLIDEVG